MKKRHFNFFWISYADLMTVLFFVMLILFASMNVSLKKERERAEKAEIAKTKIEKIMAIDDSIGKIDSTYFRYDKKFKRFTLKGIDVKFTIDSDDINDLSKDNREKLKLAGKTIEKFINTNVVEKDVKYQLIIEGQTSKDKDPALAIHNYHLSYRRALSLYNFWKKDSIFFNEEKCEVVISGSGSESQFRDTANNVANQRFVIHIIPKIDLEKIIYGGGNYE